MEKVIIYTDGGARGNPGPAGIGAVIFDEEKKEILGKYKKFIGKTTNNQAEYQAVVLGLEKALALGAKEVELRLDSELVCKQINGEFKLKNPDFQPHFIKIHNLKLEFKKVEFKHVRREQNKIADALANEAMDEGK
jgi:ribonuclease HI